MRKKLKYRICLLNILLKESTGFHRYLSLSLFIGVLILTLELLTPQIYKLFIDEVVLGGQFSLFKYVVIGYLSCYFFNALLKYIKYTIKIKYSNKLLITVKAKIFNNYLHMPFERCENLDVGEAKVRIEDDTLQVEEYVTHQSVDLIINYLTFVICAVLLIIIQWRLALFAFATVPLTILLDSLLSKREKTLNATNRVNEKNMSSWLHESLKGWREIKSLCLGKYQERKYRKFLYNYAVYYCKWINYWTARVLVMPKIKEVLLAQFAFYYLGGLLIMNHTMKIGELLVFIQYFEKLTQATNNISSCDAHLQANLPHTDKLITELNTKWDKKSYTECPICINDIVVKDVSYAYPNSSSKVLEHIDIHISKGDRIAIIGRSGAGKTTLLKLLTGMIEPICGKILYNNTSLSDYDIDKIHSKIGFVMQDHLLFNSSIKDNLCYGQENATHRELIIACQKANIYDFIDNLPQKFDTIIGERGIKLSAGQQQRMELARMFLISPDIYIFDEATSNLDSCNEKYIYDAMNSIDKDKIIIIVTHRKSLLRLCNKIYSVDRKCLIDKDM